MTTKKYIEMNNAIPASTGIFAAFEWTIAGRYLRSRRRETFVSVIAGFSFLGILLGVATLIVVMSVMNGFRTELLNKILGINGHIILHSTDRPLDDFDELTKQVGNLPDVRLAVPMVNGQALISGPAGALGGLVRGMKLTDIERMADINNKIVAGSLNGFDDGNGIAIGTRLASNLGVTVGDQATIVSPKGSITPMGVTPRVKSYTVAAIFEIGMHEYDNSLVFMPFEQAQLYFNLEGQVSNIEIFTNDPDRLDGVIKAVNEAVERPIWLSDWRRRYATFFSALEVERNVMFLVLTLIIVVAALNIISGLTLLVKDKARYIAILRTMGASRGSILRIFMIAGSSIGVLGTIAGTFLGLLICDNIEAIREFISSITRRELFPSELYYLSKLPAEIQTGQTTAIILMAIGIAFLATIYPAWRAASLDPLEALRYE